MLAGMLCQVCRPTSRTALTHEEALRESSASIVPRAAQRQRVQRRHGASLWHGCTDEQRSLVEQLSVYGALWCTARSCRHPCEASYISLVVPAVVLHTIRFAWHACCCQQCTLPEVSGRTEIMSRSSLHCSYVQL